MKSPAGSTNKHCNRLINEKSPYLLQHARNPVDWYSWGKDAFEKAQTENKPIFLSIGYSTCHWCHVMAHESFEDSDLARRMNDVFVSIKVDREERPDIDKVYMTVCQMLTGSGGWPLTIIMTPDKKPFFAATYIPKEGIFGRIGMVELTTQVRDIWENKMRDVYESADQIINALRSRSEEPEEKDISEDILDKAYEQLLSYYDERHGGFGNAPKFPSPQNLLFLLRHWKRTGNKKIIGMVEKTLRAMHNGGIFDHVGFGFHRYSTDDKWLVPHFEKMLYDQAMLAIAYSEAYQATKKHEFATTARKIFAYVSRSMMSPGGAFYSAEDADSEGEEGKFYLWTEDEIRKILDEDEADLIKTLFNIQKNGNFLDEASGEKKGSNILYLKKTLAESAAVLGISEKDIKAPVEKIFQKLNSEREQRIHPSKDDKILTDWNGLMIAAFAIGARVLDEPIYGKMAEDSAGFILKKLSGKDGRLLHRYRDNEAGIEANLDDYAFFIWGLIELYETTFKIEYLHTALSLNERLMQDFWDEEDNGFYFTSDNGEDMIIRQKEITEGALPSGNSVAMLNLIRLGLMTSNPHLNKKAFQIGKAFSSRINNSPASYTFLMTALDLGFGPSFEVVIAGSSLYAQDTIEMLKALRTEYLPNAVVIFRPVDKKPLKISKISKFTESLTSIDKKATAYICVKNSCKLPTTDINEMLACLRGSRD